MSTGFLPRPSKFVYHVVSQPVIPINLLQIKFWAASSLMDHLLPCSGFEAVAMASMNIVFACPSLSLRGVVESFALVRKLRDVGGRCLVEKLLTIGQLGEVRPLCLVRSTPLTLKPRLALAFAQILKALVLELLNVRERQEDRTALPILNLLEVSKYWIIESAGSHGAV